MLRSTSQSDMGESRPGDSRCYQPRRARSARIQSGVVSPATAVLLPPRSKCAVAHQRGRNASYRDNRPAAGKMRLWLPETNLECGGKGHANARPATPLWMRAERARGLPLSPAIPTPPAVPARLASHPAAQLHDCFPINCRVQSSRAALLTEVNGRFPQLLTDAGLHRRDRKAAKVGPHSNCATGGPGDELTEILRALPRFCGVA